MDYHALPSEPPSAGAPSANAPPVTTAGPPGPPGSVAPGVVPAHPGVGVPGQPPVIGQPVQGYYPQVQPAAQAYVQTTPHDASSSSFARLQQNINSVMNDLTRVTQSTLSHFTMAPNPLNTTLGKIEQTAKIAMAGGPELFWRTSFNPSPTDKLVAPPYVCYLSTSMGLVSGFLYISHSSASFSSDRPLAYAPAPGRVAHSYYKVVLPLEKVGSVLTSHNPVRPTDQYIQIVTVDGAEFWYTGFISFSAALETLQMTVAQHQSLASAAANGVAPPGATPPQQGTATGTPAPTPAQSSPAAAPSSSTGSKK